MSRKYLQTPLRFLAIAPNEISLAAVLRSGQSFRWTRSPAQITSNALNEVEWSLGQANRTIVLRQDAQGIHYTSLYPLKSVALHAEDVKADTTLAYLREYFALHISLAALYADWSARDPHFVKTTEGGRFSGIRVLKQDPWETLVWCVAYIYATDCS